MHRGGTGGRAAFSVGRIGSFLGSCLSPTDMRVQRRSNDHRYQQSPAQSEFTHLHLHHHQPTRPDSSRVMLIPIQSSLDTVHHPIQSTHHSPKCLPTRHPSPMLPHFPTVITLPTLRPRVQSPSPLQLIIRTGPVLKRPLLSAVRGGSLDGRPQGV